MKEKPLTKWFLPEPLMQATGFKPCGGGGGGRAAVAALAAAGQWQQRGVGRSSAVASDVTCISSRLKEAATAAVICHRSGGGPGGTKGAWCDPSESIFFQVK